MAKHAKGSTRIYEEVRSMSKISPEHTPTRRISKSPLQPLALCTVGLGYCWPVPKAAENKKYLLVGTDYFTKWVEVEPYANIRDVDIKRSFSGRTLSLTSGYLIPSSRTMDFNSTANPLGDTVVSWELQTGILLQHILKGTDKLKLLTRS